MLKELPSILTGVCVLVLFGAALTGAQVEETTGSGPQAIAEKSSSLPESERTRTDFEKRSISGREIAFNQSAE